jgi:DUF917 family protein
MTSSLKVRLQTREDVEDFVYGCGYLATGGGGPMEDGIEILNDELDAGHEVGWVDLDTIPDDAWTITTARIGGRPAATGGPTPDELATYGLIEPDVHGNEGGPPGVNRQVVAVQELARFAGVEIAAIVSLELGGATTPGGMVTANRLGIPTVDGDYTGRAIPELGNMKVEMCGKDSAPLAFVDRWDNVSILQRVGGSAMADRIGRMLGVASFGRIGMAGYLLTAGEAREAMVPNTLSLCLDMGRAIRRARSATRPIEQLVRDSKGWLLFKGRVTLAERDIRPFVHFLGTIHLEGIDEFEGQSFRMWWKNETHVTWLNDRPLITSPDQVTAVDAHSLIPVLNPDIFEGFELAIIGMEAPDPIYRTDVGLAALSARHFGFDLDYVPIEDQLGPSIRG